MLLTIDVGNTNINIGVFDHDELVMNSRIATEKKKTSDQFAIQFSEIFRLHKIDTKNIEASIMSSVVPEITKDVEKAIKTITGKSVKIVGPGIKTGLNILTDDPSELGADLVAGAVGAIACYKLPAFVVDLGTATKIYVIDRNCGYRGGTIAPGVAISLDALTKGASLLPAISMEAPKKVCGTNTIDCMQSGIVMGTAAMIDGLIDKLSEEMGKPETIITTGGLSGFLASVCSHEMIHDSDLLLKGLKQIYIKNI